MANTEAHSSTSSPLRLVFMGTPEFAVPSLRVLMEGEDRVVGVVTQPDQPAGRGMTVHASPVKAFADAHHTPVFQPAKLRVPGVIEQLQDWQPDLIVVAAYGKILPTTILAFPPLGCINVHASLLPKYRGAAPIQWAIANGETETGVTIMRISAQMDAGDILLQRSLPIAADETGGTLHDKLAQLGAEALRAALTLLKRGELHARAQNEAEATYAPLLKKEHGRIDWQRSAHAIERQIRAFNPWPSAYTTVQGKLLKIFAAQVHDAGGEDPSSKALFAPGTVLEADADTLLIATGADILAPTEIQLEGKKKLAVKDFLKGFPLTSGIVLGT